MTQNKKCLCCRDEEVSPRERHSRTGDKRYVEIDCKINPSISGSELVEVMNLRDHVKSNHRSMVSFENYFRGESRGILY